MQIMKWTRACCVVAALWNLVLPVPLRADAPERDELRIVDLQLDSQRALPGQYVDANGQPRRGVQIQLRSGNQVVGVATTDEQGRFRFPVAQGGVYQVAAADSLAICRAWAPRTAPPQAQPSLLLVSGVDVTRAQRPFGEIVTNPLVIAAAIAAAVAIPIAIHNSGDDGNGS